MWNSVTRFKLSLRGFFWTAVALRFLSLIPAVIDEDEAWFSASALSLKNPAQYFQRAIDNKPPGTVIFYWLCGGDLRVTRTVMIGLLALTALLLGNIYRRLFAEESSEKSWLVALLFFICSAIPSFELFAVTNEGLLLFFEVLSLWFLVQQEWDWGWIFSALSFGAALVIKPTAVFLVLPVCFLIRPLRAIGWGILALLVPTYAVYTLGAHEFLYWTLVYPAQVLVAARSKLFNGSSEPLWNVFRFSLALLPLMLSAWSGFFTDFTDKTRRFFVVSWLVSALAAVAAGKGLFLHYYLLLLPPLCLLAARAFSWKGWKRRWLWIVYVASCAVVAVPAFASFWGVDLLYHEKLASLLTQVTESKDSIFVWGGSAAPLAMSKRGHATAFVTGRFLVEPYTTPEIQKRFEREIEAAPPALILDLSERGDNRFNFPVSYLPIFESFLKANYFEAEAPSLPWAHFYLRNNAANLSPLLVRSNPDRQVSQLRMSFPPLSEVSRALLWDGVLRSGWALSALHPKANDDLQKEFESIRRRIRSKDETVTSNEVNHLAQSVLDRFRVQGYGEPYSLSSLFSWVGLSIVQLQPVTLPRQKVLESSTKADYGF